jgi:hypothetical protein
VEIATFLLTLLRTFKRINVSLLAQKLGVKTRVVENEDHKNEIFEINMGASLDSRYGN